MKRAIILTLLLALLNTTAIYADELKEIKVTCYCPESSGQITADGSQVREGICASSRERLGDCAMVYTVSGNFLGYYECKDVGGTDAIRKGYVIDIWKPSLQSAREFMALTEGKVLIKFIEAPRG